MGVISLQPITKANWEEAIKLKVGDGQEHFVAPNVYSLAEAAYEDEEFPFGIYVDDIMVGFLMYYCDRSADYPLWGVSRLMIDLQHQGKGYGRKAMQLLIDKIRAETDAEGLLISYVPDNISAAKLYASLGFVDEGIIYDDEILVIMRFQDKIGPSSSL